MDIQLAFLLSFVVFYVFACFKLANFLLPLRKLKKPESLFLYALLTIATVALSILYLDTVYLFAFFIALLFLIFWRIYQVSFSALLVCVLNFSMYSLALTTILATSYSLYTDLTPYEIFHDENLRFLIINAALFMSSVWYLLLSYCIPKKFSYFFIKDSRQILSLTAWLFVVNIYLLMYTSMYDDPLIRDYIVINQLVITLLCLTGMNIIFYSAMRNATYYEYKEISEKLQVRIQEEALFRKLLLAESIEAYGFNCTQDVITYMKSISQDTNEILDIPYTQHIYELLPKLLLPEDLDASIRFFAKENLIEAYNNGTRELTLDSRRMFEKNSYRWVRTSIFLMQVENSEDIYAFAYIKDIEAIKQKQVALEYKAERDALTGAYNKSMTENLVSYEVANVGVGALLMVDIDNFKSINDNFGHAFGDLVICEVVKKLHDVFRHEDIVGRIGGDEFIVFMRNTADMKIIKKKADRVCKTIKNTYTDKNNNEHTISASVGIAIAPKHAETFEDLYKFADIALYQSKNKGKNTATFYDGEEFTAAVHKRTEIENVGSMKKSFNENRAEYIFKILHTSENPAEALRTVVEFIAKYFNFDRGYILSYDYEGRLIKNNYEWCDKNIPTCYQYSNSNTKYLPKNLMEHYAEKSTLVCSNIEDIENNDERLYYSALSIKSFVQFPMMNTKNFIGIIGFDNCLEAKELPHKDLEALISICNVLSTFFLKQYISDRASSHLNILMDVMDRFDSSIYVIRKRDYRIIYSNKQFTDLILGDNTCLEDCESQKEAEIYGKLCFEAIRGLNAPCPDCPLIDIVNKTTTRSIKHIHNEKLGIWTKITASPIIWLDNEPAYIVDSTDITDYIRNNEIGGN